uniref:G-patch domain-containing protein n=1 Tax=Macrostomum lignano TaxID=282301 RepID=A0A1I8FM32_9PLAT
AGGGGAALSTRRRRHLPVAAEVARSQQRPRGRPGGTSRKRTPQPDSHNYRGFGGSNGQRGFTKTDAVSLGGLSNNWVGGEAGSATTTWAASVARRRRLQRSQRRRRRLQRRRSRLAEAPGGSGGGSYCGGSGCSGINGGKPPKQASVTVNGAAEHEAPASTELRQQPNATTLRAELVAEHLTFAAATPNDPEQESTKTAEQSRSSSRSKRSSDKSKKKQAKARESCKSKKAAKSKRSSREAREAQRSKQEAAKASREAAKSKSSKQRQMACKQTNNQFKLPTPEVWRVIKSKKNSNNAKANRAQATGQARRDRPSCQSQQSVCRRLANSVLCVDEAASGYTTSARCAVDAPGQMGKPMIDPSAHRADDILDLPQAAQDAVREVQP